VNSKTETAKAQVALPPLPKPAALADAADRALGANPELRDQAAAITAAQQNQRLACQPLSRSNRERVFDSGRRPTSKRRLRRLFNHNVKRLHESFNPITGIYI